MSTQPTEQVSSDLNRRFHEAKAALDEGLRRSLLAQRAAERAAIDHSQSQVELRRLALSFDEVRDELGLAYRFKKTDTLHPDGRIERGA